jgi:serine/threonine-protein kinase
MGTKEGTLVLGAAGGDASPTTAAQTRVGSTLRGKWHLDTLLGVGGMAAVYAATHRNGTRAAVKILHHELSVNDGFRRRFLREGQIANMVGHDGAVKVLDDDTAEDGSVYLVTELLEGETLEDRCERCGGTLGEDEVLPIADQILDVLAAAHAKDLVHRDLKPENIFLTRVGQVKVLDFGIARARALSSGTTATQAGAMLGTPPFMAPEQARGLWNDVDGRTDLWACGATMFRLLSGRLVHQGRTPNEELLSAMSKPAPPLATVAPGVSPGVARLVDRALAFDMSDRWPDAAAMQEAVRNAYVQQHSAPISEAPRLVVPAASLHVTLRSLPDLDDEGDIGKMATLAASGESVPSGSARSKTSEPVSSSLPGTSMTRVSRGARWALLAVAASVACAAAWFAFGRAHPMAPLAPSSAAQVEPPIPPPPVTASMPAAAATPPLVQPAVSAPPQLPPTGAATATAPAPRSSTAKVPAGRSPGSKPNCTPPYVVDPATGKKNWKLECL